MAKPKSPLLSLGARGTIGDALTYQKRGQDTIVREKPTPAYRRTLPQLYQRWLYQDYAYRWTQQSQATQRQYAADGSRFHLTGFQYWMKDQLTLLPDIAGMWHLDYIVGNQVRDSSRELNHGTVFGASLVDGVISQALSFDGVDDYVEIPDHPTLDISGNGSLEFWLKSPAWEVGPIVMKGETTSSLAMNYAAWSYANGKPTFFIGDGVGPNTVPILTPLSINTWYHILFTWDGTKLRIYLDGVEHNTANQTRTPAPNTDKLMIAWTGMSGHYANIVIDELRIYTRALDATDAQRHAQRRY